MGIVIHVPDIELVKVGLVFTLGELFHVTESEDQEDVILQALRLITPSESYGFK